jgi:hypothetical protein
MGNQNTICNIDGVSDTLTLPADGPYLAFRVLLNNQQVYVKVSASPKHYDRLRDVLTGYENECVVYAGFIGPIVNRNVCPFFLKLIGVAYNCPLENLVNRVTSRRRIERVYPNFTDQILFNALVLQDIRHLPFTVSWMNLLQVAIACLAMQYSQLTHNNLSVDTVKLVRQPHDRVLYQVNTLVLELTCEHHVVVTRFDKALQYQENTGGADWKHFVTSLQPVCKPRMYAQLLQLSFDSGSLQGDTKDLMSIIVNLAELGRVPVSQAATVNPATQHISYHLEEKRFRNGLLRTLGLYSAMVNKEQLLKHYSLTDTEIANNNYLPQLQATVNSILDKQAQIEDMIQVFQLKKEYLKCILEIEAWPNPVYQMFQKTPISTGDPNEDIDLFLETFNARHVQHFSKADLQQLKQQGVLNKVQLLLIQNVKQPYKKYQVVNILGPNALTIHHLGYKRFYMFGETHVSLPQILEKCYRLPLNNTLFFDEYLNRLSKQTPAFIDFFYETEMFKDIKTNFVYSQINYARQEFPFVVTPRNPASPEAQFRQFAERVSQITPKKNVKPIMSTSYTLSATEAVVKTCLQPLTRNLPAIAKKEFCDLVRYHYVDVRSEDYLQDLTNLYMYKLYILSDVFFGKMNWVSLYSGPHVILMLRALDLDGLCQEVIASGNYGQTYLERLLNNTPIVSKQFDKCDPQYKLQIRNFIEFKLNELYTPFVAQTFQGVLDMMQGAVPLNNNIITFTCEILFKSQAFMMDFYCLCRMFRSFRASATQPSQPCTVILYAGDAHTTTYREFLESLPENNTVFDRRIRNNDFYVTLPVQLQV